MATAFQFLFARWRRWREVRRRVVVEDVLKHLLTRLEGREASPESVAGHLGWSAHQTSRRLVEMESAGLLRSEAGQLHLTPEGEKWAKQVVRAHRLWETYLANEARLPISRLHKPAEQAEHRLTTRQLDELDASLGHPRRDPHGDPIPTAAGEIAPAKGQPLTTWPLGQTAEITHLEDEPEALFKQIPSRLRPGSQVRPVASTAEQLTVSDGQQEYQLPPLVAGNIQVAAPATAPLAEEFVPLSELRVGEEGEVVRLGEELRGFTRRRLLDLGLTPNSRVAVHLDNAFGDPRAFRVRGTTIALRTDQASKIWVKRVPQAAPAIQ